MNTPASFHTNQFDVYVGGEAQQLGAREFLADHDLATPVKPDQMKNCLAKPMVCSSMGRLLRKSLIGKGGGPFYYDGSRIELNGLIEKKS